jgi:hypothetical protein
MAAKKQAQFKSSEVLAVAMLLLVEGSHPAKTCCSAIGQAIRKLTGAAPETTKKGKKKQSMPTHPLYKRAVAYLEPFRPTEREAGISDSKRLVSPKNDIRTWWRTPSHPRIYAHKTERLVALTWAFLNATKAKD